MWAPEDVFKSSSLPQGNYWPSPMINQHENVLLNSDKIESKNDMDVISKSNNVGTSIFTKASKNIDSKPASASHDKENIKPLKRTVNVDNASTSVDDLIKNIDDNLAIDPDFVRPTPSSKTQVNNILSVSDHSDTTLNVLSPSTLNFYMDRFKHSQPTHPSKRPLKTSPLFEAEEVINPGNLPSSNDSSYNTLTLDTSSYLERIVSSDDSTEWNFTAGLNEEVAPTESVNELVSDSNGNSTPTVVLNSYKTKQVSFIEQLTGKTFSELSEFVPKEVIYPADENEDILYQWRLKKHIAEAKNSMPADDSCMAGYENKLCRDQNKLPFSTMTSNVSKEIQTDVEKRESSCQADMIPNCSNRNESAANTNIKAKIFNPVHSQIQDSCSDSVSISSVSTDDLTNISDLDDEEELFNVVEEDGACDLTVVGTSMSKTATDLDDCDKSFNRNPVLESSSLELLQNRNPTEYFPPQQTETSVSENQVNVEELLSYLDNIRSNVDDELLNVFIDRYENVLSQMKEIENEISRQCNED